MPFHESIGLLSQSLTMVVAGPLVRGDDVDERVLGREHHVRRAEQRVGPRREHLDLDVLVALDREQHATRPSSGRSSCAASA